MRADRFLYLRGLAKSRSHAASLIDGGVTLDGKPIQKPAQDIPEDTDVSRIRIQNPSKYVSRGGYKLEAALEGFRIDVKGKTVLDLGASTGGFTDCLLQHGAARVFAVDVGHGQLDAALQGDPRVISMEGTNARLLTSEDFGGEHIDLAVSDLSFISQALIYPAVFRTVSRGGAFISLIKPQFEAGREKVGKKGVVRDPAVHLEVLESFLRHAKENNFTVLGITYSPIRGPEGNIEYLGYLKKGGEADCVPDLRALVDASHSALKEGHGEI